MKNNSFLPSYTFFSACHFSGRVHDDDEGKYETKLTLVLEYFVMHALRMFDISPLWVIKTNNLF